MTLTFVVWGNSQPAGSKRGFAFARKDGSSGVSITDDNPKSSDWKRVVAGEVRRSYTGPLLTGALSVTFTFYRCRPQGHFGKKGLNKKGLDTMYPISKPDLLKTARGIEDALTNVLWVDDAQIVSERLFKMWAGPGEAARVVIEVEDLLTDTLEAARVEEGLLENAS